MVFFPSVQILIRCDWLITSSIDLIRRRNSQWFWSRSTFIFLFLLERQMILSIHRFIPHWIPPFIHLHLNLIFFSKSFFFSSREMHRFLFYCLECDINSFIVVWTFRIDTLLWFNSWFNNEYLHSRCKEKENEEIRIEWNSFEIRSMKIV